MQFYHVDAGPDKQKKRRKRKGVFYAHINKNQFNFLYHLIFSFPASSNTLNQIIWSVWTYWNANTWLYTPVFYSSKLGAGEEWSKQWWYVWMYEVYVTRTDP